MRHNLFIAFASVALAVTAGGALCAQAPPSDAPQVRTRSGVVAGRVFEGVSAFKDIPYAAPPVGALRWRAPQPAATWSGVRAGDDYGASCPQPVPIRFVVPGSRAATTSEDCLTLNVWTPAVRGAPLPVMVFVHGGSNVTGTGSQTFYDGTNFARDGIVLVTLNYRLGLLGFFAPDAASNDVDFGLEDQLAALRWVRANIAAFGGDPSRVTLFGESAGALDTLLLAMSPQARGLFVRAIAESAPDPGEALPTLDQARKQTRDLLARMGAPKAATLATLRALPASAFLAAGDDDQIGPAVDGGVVARSPVDERRDIAIPLILGTNDGEGSLLGIAPPPYADVVPKLPPADLAQLVAGYRAAGAADDATLARDLFRDAYFAAPARKLARIVSRAKVPVYTYRFDYILSLFAGVRPAATHGSEIPYVFDSFSTSALSDTDRTVIAALHGCWGAFAKTGVPACDGARDWLPVDRANGREMIFDATSAMRPIDAAPLDLLERDLAALDDQ